VFTDLFCQRLSPAKSIEVRSYDIVDDHKLIIAVELTRQGCHSNAESWRRGGGDWRHFIRM